MHWVIFGDDWGRHISTTQHLVAQLPRDDKVIWVNSLGLRSPGLNARDVKRVFSKLGGSGKPVATTRLAREPDRVLNPTCLPWHLSPAIRSGNRKRVAQAIRSAMDALAMDEPNVLVTYPVPFWYLDFPFNRLGYLRLDDYALLPGVDPRMVEATEPDLMKSADVIFVTAKALMPETPEPKWRYLPQGVDLAHFAKTPTDLPAKKVLGFFGLFAEWLDTELIASVAEACPDWTLEFVGPQRVVPPEITRQSNVHLLDPVPYAELPQRMAEWTAAWVPFRLNELTKGVNPLKLREYLAAGLPTLSTPIPESAALAPAVQLVRDAGDVRDALEQIVSTDSPAARGQRRESVREDGWDCRAAQLREAMAR